MEHSCSDVLLVTSTIRFSRRLLHCRQHIRLGHQTQPGATPTAALTSPASACADLYTSLMISMTNTQLRQAPQHKLQHFGPSMQSCLAISSVHLGVMCTGVLAIRRPQENYLANWVQSLFNALGGLDRPSCCARQQRTTVLNRTVSALSSIPAR